LAIKPFTVTFSLICPQLKNNNNNNINNNNNKTKAIEVQLKH